MIGRESRLDGRAASIVPYIGAASGDAVKDNAHAQSGTGDIVSLESESRPRATASHGIRLAAGSESESSTRRFS